MRKKQFTEYLPFNALSVNERVQRAIIPARVKKLAVKWSFRGVGVVTISRRDGQNYIVDGQHRWAAAMQLGHGTSKVLCHIYTDLSEQEEAALFLTLNDSRSVSPYDRYRVGLIARDPICVGTFEILEEHGLKIGHHRGDGVVCCIDKALALYERDPELLNALCALLVGAWGTRPSAFEQVVFSGAAVVLGRYNGELNVPGFTKKLSGYRGGPSALVGDARGLADYKPISVTRAAAEIMVATYNKGRRTGQLSPL